MRAVMVKENIKVVGWKYITMSCPSGCIQLVGLGDIVILVSIDNLMTYFNKDQEEGLNLTIFLFYELFL